jgi:hypothetical protein
MALQAILTRIEGMIGAARFGVLVEFLRFGVVGTIGFVVDTAVLYAGLALGLGFMAGGRFRTWWPRPRPGRSIGHGRFAGAVMALFISNGRCSCWSI